MTFPRCLSDLSFLTISAPGEIIILFSIDLREKNKPSNAKTCLVRWKKHMQAKNNKSSKAEQSTK
jgi:hypothetical protein